MDFQSVYTVKKEFEKERFLRALLIELGTRKDTPVDVVDAELKDVVESVREVIVCTAQIDGKCTASIGFDRQEPYIDYETYKEKIGDQYITRQRPVTKYKTVTDWQLFSQDYSGTATCAAYNSDEFGFDDSDIVSAIKSTKIENIIEKGEATVNSAGLSQAISSCKSNVELNAVTFPGDRHKDVIYNSDATIDSLSCYKLPYYTVTYTYNGVDYTASCFACGNINIHTEVPPNDIDITAIVKENTEELEKAQKKSWTFFTLSIILSFALCFFLKFAWLFPVPIVLLLKAKKDSDKYREKYQEYSDYLSSDVASSKVTSLQQALGNHGFEPLSESFSNSMDIFSVPGATPLKPIKNRVIICWVLSAILVISSIFTISSEHSKNLHSPKSVDIKIIEKDERFDSDVSGYIGGCYYIELECEVKAKKLGIEYIDMEIHVSDKSGDELGTVKSSLSNLEIEKGDKESITVTLEENQPERNKFFSELYDAKSKDLKYEVEITGIKFSDGEYYRAD